MTASPRHSPSARRMRGLLARLLRRYGSDAVDYDFLRTWRASGNQTDQDFQWMAEDNARAGRWSVARFCRLMCFTSQTQRRAIG